MAVETFSCDIVEGKRFIKGPCLYEKGLTTANNKTCAECHYHQLQNPQAQEKRIPPRVGVKNPETLAKAYLDGASFFNQSTVGPVLEEEKVRNFTLQSLAQEVYGGRGKDDPVTKTLKNLRLDPIVQKKICTALADFTLAISIARRENVKSKIESKSKNRRDRKKLIDHLEKARNIALDDLSLDQTGEKLEEVLKGLRPSKNVGQSYSQISEIDYILKRMKAISLLAYLYAFDTLTIDEVFKPEKPVSDRMTASRPDMIESRYRPLPTPGEDLKRSLLTEALAEAKSRAKERVSKEKKKLDDSISDMASMKIERSRPPELFSRAMLIVIYRLLNKEGKIPIEKAKKYTAIIVKGKLIKHGFTEFANLDAKDVDNALHR